MKLKSHRFWTPPEGGEVEQEDGSLRWVYTDPKWQEHPVTYISTFYRRAKGNQLIILMKRLIRAAKGLGKELALQDGTPARGDMPSALMAAQLGFQTKTKVRPRHDYPNGEFCSSLWWPTPEGTVLGPKIGRQLYKHAWTYKPESVREAWFDAVVAGNSLSWSFVPVLRTLQLHYTTLKDKRAAARALAKKRFEEGKTQVAPRPYKPYVFSRTEALEESLKFKSGMAHAASDDTAAFFAQRYAMDAREVELELKALLAVHKPGQSVAHPFLLKLHKRDNE